jgi:hypothetical protein
MLFQSRPLSHLSTPVPLLTSPFLLFARSLLSRSLLSRALLSRSLLSRSLSSFLPFPRCGSGAEESFDIIKLRHEALDGVKFVYAACLYLSVCVCVCVSSLRCSPPLVCSRCGSDVVVGQSHAVALSETSQVSIVYVSVCMHACV